MYVFLYHLLIYCLSATHPPFCALPSDTGAGFYSLHFSLASWLDVRACQQRALERRCKSGRERRDYFFFQCFVFLLGGNWIGTQGSWQCFLERKVVLWSGSKSSPTCVNIPSPQRSESLPSRGPFSECLSFFIFIFPSALGVVTGLCSYYFRVLLYLFR